MAKHDLVTLEWLRIIFGFNPCECASQWLVERGVLKHVSPNILWEQCAVGDWLLWLCILAGFADRSESLALRLVGPRLSPSEWLDLQDVAMGRLSWCGVRFVGGSDRVRNLLLGYAYYCQNPLDPGGIGHMSYSVAQLCGSKKLAEAIRHEFTFEEIWEALMHKTWKESLRKYRRA